MQTIIEQVYAATVLWWQAYDELPLLSAITATVVAILRMRSTGRVIWSEALLCGVFAAIATVCLSFLSLLLAIDIPPEVSSGVGGAIGWYGAARSIQFLEDKITRGNHNGSNK